MCNEIMQSNTASALLGTQQRPFGIAVSGLSLEQCTSCDINQLKQWLGQHGVAVIKGAFAHIGIDDQAARDDVFVRFLARLGPMTFTQGETPVEQQPLLNRVSNVGRITPPKSVFHTDTSYVADPPAYTALRAVSLPSQGGDTVFSDQYLAYETLPQVVKERLAGVKVLHQVSGLTAESLASAQPDSLQNWHLLFKVHPLSGRKAIFLSTPQRCREMTGFPDEYSQKIVRILYQHSTRYYRAKHHKWQVDDLLIWDNRCTMHRGDHAAVVGDRVFHRGMVLASS